MKEELREVEDRMKRSGYEEKMAKRFPEVNQDMRPHTEETNIVLSKINENKFILRHIIQLQDRVIKLKSNEKILGETREETV